jgi:hypothetical protein
LLGTVAESTGNAWTFSSFFPGELSHAVESVLEEHAVVVLRDVEVSFSSLHAYALLPLIQ